MLKLKVENGNLKLQVRGLKKALKKLSNSTMYFDIIIGSQCINYRNTVSKTKAKEKPSSDLIVRGQLNSKNKSNAPSKNVIKKANKLASTCISKENLVNPIDHILLITLARFPVTCFYN